MINLRIKSFAPPMPSQVEDFKAYVGQSGTAADGILKDTLAEALINVGEYEDRSLVAATYELECTREPGQSVKLYGTPERVLSVTDADGNALEYGYVAGRKYVSIPGRAETVIATYTTTVHPGAMASLIGKVWKYGKARYEERDDDAAAILMR